jgi:hypothetical protein
MIKKLFFKLTLTTLALVFTLGVSLGSSDAREQPSIKKVRGEGISFQLEDEQEVRATAIDDAIKKAIVAAYDSLVKDTETRVETELLKESVFLAPLNYVLDYRVLSEGWIRHLVIEPGLPTPPPSALKSQSAEDIDDNLGDGFDEESEEFLASQEQGLKLYHVWIEASVDFKELKSDLSLTPSFEGENTSLVTILLLTISDYKKFTKIKDAIEELENVKEVGLDSFLKGKIVLTAEVWGNPHELLEKLRKNKVLENFDIIPSGTDRITIKGVLQR